MPNSKKEQTYRVYVIELDPDVMSKTRFAKANPDRREDKPCVYVGSTVLTPEERFQRHLEGRKASKYVTEFGVRLRPKLYRNVGPFELREQAEAAEERLAERLRKRGYGVGVVRISVCEA